MQVEYIYFLSLIKNMKQRKKNKNLKPKVIELKTENNETLHRNSLQYKIHCYTKTQFMYEQSCDFFASTCLNITLTPPCKI